MKKYSVFILTFLFFTILFGSNILNAQQCNTGSDCAYDPNDCSVLNSGGSISCSGGSSFETQDGNGMCHTTTYCPDGTSTLQGNYVSGAICNNGVCQTQNNGGFCQTTFSWFAYTIEGESYACGSGSGWTCNNNSICDSGESPASCPSECPVPNYTISVIPDVRSINNGDTTTYSITLTPINNRDMNNLGSYNLVSPIPGCPSGATCSYFPYGSTTVMTESFDNNGDSFVEPAGKNVIVTANSAIANTYSLNFSATKSGSSAQPQNAYADLIINSTIPTVDIKGWGNTVPQSSPTDGPITMNSGTSGGLVWTFTGQVTSCTITRNGTPVAGDWVNNTSAGVGPLTSTQTHSIVCTGPGGTSNTDSFTHTVPNTMDGNLSPATESCIIQANNSNCTINFTWITNNPVGTSAVTSNTNNSGASSPNFNVANGNNSSAPTPFIVPGGFGPNPTTRTFYLYNNGIKLDEEHVASTCIGGTTWNGTICNAGTPTVDIKGWGNTVPQSSPTDGPITMNSGTSGGLVWTSTNATNCIISRNGGSLGNFAVNGSAGVGPLTSTQTHSIVCTGPGGTSNTDYFTHSVGNPPSPSNLILSCPAPGTTVNANWTAPVGGWNEFYVRANPGADNYDWPPAISPNPDINYGTSWSFSSTPGQTYHVWVHTKDPNNGSWSDPPIDANVTCVSSNSCPAGNPFVASKTLGGALRNDHEGWVGTKITIGSTAQEVRALGRIRVAGNTGTHTVKVVNSNGTDVANGSVSIDMSSGTAGEYKYASLATPITLLANTSYYIVSREFNGGDQWYDTNGTTIVPSSVGTVPNSAWATTVGSYNDTGLANASYVPIDLCLSPSTSGNPIAPVVNLTISNQDTTDPGGATLSWSATNSPTGCTATGGGAGWAGPKGASGSITVSNYPAGGYTFSMYCTNAAGDGPTDSESLTVNPAAQVTSEITVIKAGQGTVSSNPSGIDCGLDCTGSYTEGSQVTLNATPATGRIFTGWGGLCAGTPRTDTSCEITVPVGGGTVNAYFAINPTFKEF